MNVYESLTANTPTTFIRLEGESTSLGDAIEQYSSGDNQIVLVSDGNSNFGKDIDESLQYAKEMGTTVYSVAPDLEKNDISVQMLGDKTVVIGNENQFDILVSQAEEGEIKYKLTTVIDDKIIIHDDRIFTQSGHTKIIRFTKIFGDPDNPRNIDDLGSHEIKVEMTPLSPDMDAINNKYYKSIYVVPKPKIQLIADDSSAPLSDALFNLYDVSNTDKFTNLDKNKALVLDNQRVSELSNDELKTLNDFITNGNGLVVVGGERSYDNGNYLDSAFEELLPVTSRSTDWRGDRNVVLMMDLSHSVDYGQNTGHVKANVLHILDDPELRSAYVGIIAFGSEGDDVSGGLVYLGNINNIQHLQDKIRNYQLAFTSETSLESGLAIANEWLEDEGTNLEIIIISDGGMGYNYDESLEIASEMHENGINFYYYHLTPSAAQALTVYDEDGEVYAKKLMDEVDGYYTKIPNVERIDIEENDDFEIEEETEIPQLTSFPLIEYNPNHFITRNIEIEGNITGYNDVTPKPGADRIIITSTGKPVVTTWRYGLGRVAAITTDNGKGGQNTWASQMYSGNNSKLISSTMNWAIGNPQVEEGTVVEAEDTWFGTPATLYITHYDGSIPKLRYKGDTLELAVTGRNTYETTIDPKNIGFHDVSGYPIAVNYAIEYRDVGMNEDLPVSIKANGGKTYTENEALALLLADARGNSLKSVQRSESQKLYFLIAALLLFLGEIAVRRIREIRESKKGD
jgi:uncharacterized membrane protein